MAAPTKKRAVEEEMEILERESDDEEDSGAEDGQDVGDSGEEEEEVNEEIQVDFEARNPEDCDFHGIKKLLHQLFLKANINLSELTDTIISQNYVGSVIKQCEVDEEMDDDDDDDDYDVLGVLSAINITDKKDVEFVKQIKSHILDKCGQCAQKQKEKLSQILSHSSQHVGLILSERLVNIPPQIALPSYESLKKEIDKAKGKKMKYNFDFYLLVAKSMKLSAPEANKGAKVPDMPTVFINVEDAYFLEESVLTFEYSVASEHEMMLSGEWDDEQDEYEPFRTVMVVPGNKLDSVINKMRGTLSL